MQTSMSDGGVDPTSIIHESQQNKLLFDESFLAMRPVEASKTSACHVSNTAVNGCGHTLRRMRDETDGPGCAV